MFKSVLLKYTGTFDVWILKGSNVGSALESSEEKSPISGSDPS